ncbi:GAF domain-containing sensor histidine kinase [Algihabitans albus]|uniref:GAF domain-containing sensor histidine kinase n=1 Tax=Algihabitans albus TaxID=2164067 RepID=UPI000E5CFC61|nr:GAF domain-containing sensor histidine kinase [Algihabitans albus]
MSKMLTAISGVPVPFNEGYRLSVLENCEALDQPLDPEFQRIVRLASRRFAVPIALVSLIDSERQWFFAQVGLAARETPRDQAFCAHAIVASSPLIVRDASQDPRFSDNPLVIGPPHIRFYAGVPLIIDGSALGTLCIVGFEPRPEFSAEDLVDLEDLAGLTTSLLKARRAVGATAHSEQVELERERMQALALLSHELRTPLNAIIGFADLIAEEVRGPITPPVYRGYAESMRDGGRRLERFAERVLRYTEVAYGQVEVSEERIDAYTLAERACSLVAARAMAADIALRIEPSENSAERLVLRGDPALLEQALFQVLSNAIEYGSVGQGGDAGKTTSADVVLTWGASDGGVSFAVRDRGAGLSPDRWETLIAPFSSGGDVFSRGNCDGGDCGSLGLGLALAKRLTELHGGTLTLDNCGEEGGCTIRLTLPHWRSVVDPD